MGEEHMSHNVLNVSGWKMRLARFMTLGPRTIDADLGVRGGEGCC